MVEIQVLQTEDLYRAITREIPLSYARYCKLLRNKDIKVNGKRISSSCTVQKGDILALYIQSKYEALHYSIVWENEDLLVVLKPQGIEVSDGRYNLLECLQETYTDLYACHRLDRNTQGLVLFAKSDDVLQAVQNAFRAREIEKIYLAHVFGVPKWKEKTVQAYLQVDKKKAFSRISFQPQMGFQPIWTHIEMQEDLGTSSILRVCIHSGKTHQIRALLSALGYPILGDNKYSTNQINAKYPYKYQALLAFQLIFHIQSGKLAYLNGHSVTCPKSDFFIKE